MQKITFAIQQSLSTEICEHFHQHIFPQLCSWCEKWRLHLVEMKFVEHIKKPGKEEFLIVCTNTEKQNNFYKNTAVFFRDIQKEQNKNIDHLIVSDFKNAISEHFHEQIARLWQDNAHYWEMLRERQEVFISTCMRFFTPRPKALAQLHKYIESNSKEIFVLCDVEGAGKSTLLANLYLELKDKYPTIIQFVGVGPRCEQRKWVLERLCYEIRKIHNIKEKIRGPYLFQRVEKTLAAINQKTVIILDAIDRLEPKSDCFLPWLPQKLPSNVKVVVSTRPLDKKYLKIKTSKVRNLPPFTLKEIKQILQNMGRSLQNKWHLSTTPLTLHIAHQEWWIKDEPEAKEKSLQTLFDLLLQRLEKETHPDLVPTLFSLLECSRYGIRPQELQELLFELDEEHIHQPLLLRFHKQLMARRDLFVINSSSLSETIHKRYLGSQKSLWHQYLAQYFKEQPLCLPENIYNIRKLQELPWHLVYGEMWEEAVATLCDIEFLETKLALNMASELLQDFKLLQKFPAEMQVELTPEVTIDKKVVELLTCFFEKILGGIWGIGHADLRSRPELLFQTFWNASFWYDDIAKENLFALAEHWRVVVEAKGRIWASYQTPFLLNLTSKVTQLFTYTNAKTAIFSKDNSLVVVDMNPDGIGIWEVATQEPVCFVDNLDYSDLFFTDDNKYLVLNAKKISLIDLRTGDLVNHKGLAAVSPDGKKIVTKVTKYKQIKDFETKEILCGNFVTQQYAFSPDGQKFAYQNEDHLRVMDANSGAMLKETKTRNLISITFSCDGNTIAIVGNMIAIWNIISGEKSILKGGTPRECKIFFSPDSKFILLLFQTFDNHHIEVWDLVNDQYIKEIKVKRQEIKDVKFQGDKIIVLFNSFVQIWSLPKVKLEHYYANNAHPVAISSDIANIVYKRKNNSMPLLETRPKKEHIYKVRFCNDRVLFLCKSHWKIWDMQTKQFFEVPKDGRYSKDFRYTLEKTKGGYNLIEIPGKIIKKFTTKAKIGFYGSGVVDEKDNLLLDLKIDYTPISSIYSVKKIKKQMGVSKTKTPEKVLAYIPFLENFTTHNNIIAGFNKVITITPQTYENNERTSLFQTYIFCIENSS